MEIYREQPTDVDVALPAGATQAAVIILRDGVEMDRQDFDGSTTPLPAVLSVSIPYKAVRFDGQLKLSVGFTIDGETYTKNEYVGIVTPIISLKRIEELGVAPSECAQVELFVRSIIESYTGQSFGYKMGQEIVQGAGDDRLSLNSRLLALSSFTAGGIARQPTSYSVSADGWYVFSDGPQWLEIKEAPPDELLDYHVSGPIRVPAWYRERFTDNVNYIIDGEWGYYSVPADVQAAAALLVNDYACPQAAYRDRYLNIVKSSDWTLEFNEQAWVATGNARADQILDKYKRGAIGLV